MGRVYARRGMGAMLHGTSGSGEPGSTPSEKRHLDPCDVSDPTHRVQQTASSKGGGVPATTSKQARQLISPPRLSASMPSVRCDRLPAGVTNR